MILAIDYGTRNIGIAISDGYLAQPLVSLKVESDLEALEKIKKVVLENKISKVIIGISQKQMADKTKLFANLLKKEIGLPLLLWDENMTSKVARSKMHQAGRSIAYQKKAEHMIAACLILEDYIDSCSLS